MLNLSRYPFMIEWTLPTPLKETFDRADADIEALAAEDGHSQLSRDEACTTTNYPPHKKKSWMYMVRTSFCRKPMILEITMSLPIYRMEMFTLTEHVAYMVPCGVYPMEEWRL